MKRLFPLALCACTALAHAQTLEETIQLALAYQAQALKDALPDTPPRERDRKSTRLNSSH